METVNIKVNRTELSEGINRKGGNEIRKMILWVFMSERLCAVAFVFGLNDA